MEIQEIINELNNMALSLDSPQPLIKWSILTTPHVIGCDFVCLALLELDSALISCGSVLSANDPRVAEFKDSVKVKINESAAGKEFIWEEADFFALENFSAKDADLQSKIGSFYLNPLVVRGETLGYIVIASLTENAFLKFKLNLFDIFSNQLGIGLRSLLNRNVVFAQKRQLEGARLKIEEEKKKIEAIIGGMQEGLILFDKNDAVMAINKKAKELMGLDESYQMKSATSFILGNFKKEGLMKDIVKKDLAFEMPKKAVIRFNSKGIMSDSNELLGRAVLLMDITKEKEVEQMKSDFVSAVSHELRTPLTSIREALALMAEGIIGQVNDKQKRCLTVALEDTDRLTRIINNLLSLSRIEAGKIRIKRVSVDLKALIERVFSSFEAYAVSKGVQLISNIEGGAPAVFVDPEQIIQVFTNLIGNALKFTPAGGSITVDSRQSSVDSKNKTIGYSLTTNDYSLSTKYVQVSVQDTGPGISKEDQQKLFQKFSQLDTGLTRRPGGTGLGLVISKEIVERHNGNIWVESELGRGSAFCLTLPEFTENSEYIDLIQQKIDLFKENEGSIAVALLCPVGVDKNSHLVDINLADYLMQKCRETIVRKDDAVVNYKKHCVFIVASEANAEGIQRLIDRIKEISKIGFKTHAAIFPEDSKTAEGIFDKIAPLCN